LFYTYNEAINQKVLDNSVVIVMQTKNAPIHTGHKNLINFAKQYGNVVVLIRNLRWFTRFCFTGEKSLQEVFDISSQVESLEALGVQIVYQDLNADLNLNAMMTEEVRTEWLASARKKVKPFENQLILERKINLCVLQEIRVNIWRTLYGDTLPFAFSVVGPDVDYFYAKAACDGAFTNWPANKILYPNRETDPETGFTYQTLLLNALTYEQKTICLELRQILDSVKYRFVKGLNTDLVNELNAQYSGARWRMKDIAILTDGIFGASTIECLLFSIDDISIEDMNYIP